MTIKTHKPWLLGATIVAVAAATAVGCKHVQSEHGHGEGGHVTPKAVSGVEIVVQPDDATVETNTHVQFVVRVEPNQGLQYKWYRNDMPLSGNENFAKVKGQDHWQLKLKEVQHEAAGLYYCEIRSAQGTFLTRSSKAALSVFSTNPVNSTLMSVTGPLTVLTKTRGGCPGTYYGYVKFKTSTGSSWWPNLGSRGTATDATTGIANYRSCIEVVEDTSLAVWCKNGTNSISFTNSASDSKFQFTTYVNNPTTLPSGTVLKFNVLWQ